MVDLFSDIKCRDAFGDFELQLLGTHWKILLKPASDLSPDKFAWRIGEDTTLEVHCMDVICRLILHR